jgi:predicted transcriptional regulator
MTNTVRLIALVDDGAYSIALSARTRIKSKHKGAACIVYASGAGIYVRGVDEITAQQVMERTPDRLIGTYDGTASIDVIHEDVTEWQESRIPVAA